jgi:Mn2+/Fe2+ NRAMP family transporter
MLMASNPIVMGKFTLPLYLKILGWAATAIMALAAVGMLLRWRRQITVTRGRAGY